MQDDSKDPKAPPPPGPEELAAQLETLRRDIAAIADTIQSMGMATGEAAAQGVRARAEAVRDEGAAHLRELQAKVEAAAGEAGQFARRDPAMAMGIAAGIGFLIGLLVARR